MGDKLTLSEVREALENVCNEYYSPNDDLDDEFILSLIDSHEDRQLFCDELKDNIINLDMGFDVEITYYINAMNYLRDNDPSLRISLGIATEIGYEISNLSSETLASLLATRNTEEYFYDNWIYVERALLGEEVRDHLKEVV